MEVLTSSVSFHGGQCQLVVPGAGELDAMSSSSSLNLFLRDGFGMFLFAALILGRRGELILLVTCGVLNVGC